MALEISQLSWACWRAMQMGMRLVWVLCFVFWFRFQIRVWVKGFLLSLCVCGNLSLSVCVCVSLQHNSQIKTLAESAE